MKSFVDAQGRTWELVLNVRAIQRVRDLAGIDLLDVANGALVSRLADDPCLLAQALWAVVRSEADARGVPAEAFLDAMRGPALDAAATALLQELLDFFPRALRARALGKIFARLEELQRDLAAARRMAGEGTESPAAAGPSTPGGSSSSSPAPAAAATPAA